MMDAIMDYINAGSNLIIAVGVLMNLFLAGWGLRKIEQVHIATNSKMDKLLAVTGEAAQAKGVLQGRQEVQAEGKG